MGGCAGGRGRLRAGFGAARIARGRGVVADVCGSGFEGVAVFTSCEFNFEVDLGRMWMDKSWIRVGAVLGDVGAMEFCLGGRGIVIES